MCYNGPVTPAIYSTIMIVQTIMWTISCIVIVSWTNHKCDCEHLVQYNSLLND